MALLDSKMSNPINVICFDGNNFFVAGHHVLRRYNSDMTEHEEFAYPIGAPITQVKTSLDGSTVYVLFSTGEVCSTNLDTKVTNTVIPWTVDMHIVKIMPGEKGEIFVLNNRPSGTLSATTNVERWNCDTGTIIETFPTSINRYYCMSYYPRIKRLIAMGMNLRVLVWDTNHSHLIGSDAEVFEGHHSNIMAVDDKMCAFICDDIHASHVSYYLIIYDVVNMKIAKKILCPFHKTQTTQIVTVLEQRYVIVYAAQSLWICDITGDGSIWRSYDDWYLSEHVTVSPDGMLVADVVKFYGARVSRCKTSVIPPLLTDAVQVDDRSVVLSLHVREGCVDIGGHKKFTIDMSTTVTNPSPHKITVRKSSAKICAEYTTPLFTNISFESAIPSAWIEAIQAVVSMQTAPKDEQALRTNANVVNWHKYDLLQMVCIQENHRGIYGLRVPVNAMQLIGQYMIN